MPDRRRNRGAHPRDAVCFADEALPALRRATTELCWLRTHGYPESASLKLVGDRHALRARQRDALQRCAHGDEERRRRASTEVGPEALAGEALHIDGYNALLTVESAMAGAVVLLGRDGVLRDLAAMSRHYRRVHQTVPALEAIGRWISTRRVAAVTWLLDAPISNSARLKGWIETVAQRHGWPWSARLVPNPDPVLVASAAVVATADSGILDRVTRWTNLTRHVVEETVPDAWIVDLAREERDGR